MARHDPSGSCHHEMYSGHRHRYETAPVLATVQLTRVVDGPFPSNLTILVELTITMLVKLAAVVYLAPPFALPGLIVAIVGGWCGQVYMKAELSIKRELSNAKAPMLAHLGAALTGLGKFCRHVLE